MNQLRHPDLSPKELGIVRDVLLKHVPMLEVWIFGSRAKGTAKPFSDLDLCIISNQPLGLAALAHLAEDFAESDLPWKVDLVEWLSCSESFRKIIEQDKIMLKTKGDGRHGSVEQS